MRRNLAFRRRYRAAQAPLAQLRLAQVKANAVIIRTASDNKVVTTIAAGIPPDFTDAINTINQRLDDAAIP